MTGMFGCWRWGCSMCSVDRHAHGRMQGWHGLQPLLHAARLPFVVFTMHAATSRMPPSTTAEQARQRRKRGSTLHAARWCAVVCACMHASVQIGAAPRQPIGQYSTYFLAFPGSANATTVCHWSGPLGAVAAKAPMLTQQDTMEACSHLCSLCPRSPCAARRCALQAWPQPWRAPRQQQLFQRLLLVRQPAPATLHRPLPGRQRRRRPLAAAAAAQWQRGRRPLLPRQARRPAPPWQEGSPTGEVQAGQSRTCGSRHSLRRALLWSAMCMCVWGGGCGL